MSEQFLENYKLEGESLEIRTYPDPVLTTVAKDVTEFNEELKTLCKNMLYTMYKAPGIGLAAPQIGVSKRIFVIDIDYERDETEEDSGEFLLSGFNPMIFINPTFREKEGETTYQEGCLSLPGIFEDIKRFESIIVDYYDTEGNQQSMEAAGLLSICIQHENDHLDGIVMIDRMSKLKKSFFKKKLIKAKKEANQSL